MKIKYYKSKEGIYINKSGFPYRSDSIRINGITSDLFKETFSSDWKFIEGIQEIKSVETKITGSAELKEFKLKDESFGDKLPLTLSLEEASLEYDEDDDRRVFTGKYKDYQSLYDPVFSKTEDRWEEKEFETQFLGEIEYEYSQIPEKIIIKTMREGWHRNNTVNLQLAEIACWNDIEKMLVPEFLLCERPCKISSDQTYKIIRAHVKENINGHYAEISSDYDFCFTVKKKIPVKPYVHTWEEKKENGKPYARPRIQRRTISNRIGETIFEMTPASRKYNGYPVIEGFEGSSFKDLAENIKLYLDELISFINIPLKECEHCGGHGVILGENKFQTKK